MSKPHVPQPRYSAEHKQQALDSEMPLFTFDILSPLSKRRHTCTGVLNKEDAENIIGMIRRAVEAKDEQAGV